MLIIEPDVFIFTSSSKEISITVVINGVELLICIVLAVSFVEALS